jgi:hypothetical protein
MPPSGKGFEDEAPTGQIPSSTVRSLLAEEEPTAPIPAEVLQSVLAEHGRARGDEWQSAVVPPPKIRRAEETDAHTRSTAPPVGSASDAATSDEWVDVDIEFSEPSRPPNEPSVDTHPAPAPPEDEPGTDR